MILPPLNLGKINRFMLMWALPAYFFTIAWSFSKTMGAGE